MSERKTKKEKNAMTSVVSFKLKPTPKQKRILTRYFDLYYHFYFEAIQIVRKRMKEMYASEEWKTVVMMVRSARAIGEFKSIEEMKENEILTLNEIKQYLSQEYKRQHERTLKKIQGNAKKTDEEIEKEKTRYQKIIHSLQTWDEKKAFTQRDQKEVLTKLKTIKFGILNRYQLNGATGVAVENNVRGLLKPLTKEYKTHMNMYTATVGELVILKFIVPSILSVFDRKVEKTKSKWSRQYILPRAKKMNEFNSLQCGPFVGGQRVTTPFLIDFQNQVVQFYFSRRKDNQNQKKLGKEKHVIKMDKFDTYREKLILKELFSIDQFKKTGDKKYWFFKYPTLVRKVNRSGAINFQLQITYRGIPEQIKKIGRGRAGISLTHSTIATWSINKDGVRGVQMLFPAFFEKHSYSFDGKAFLGSFEELKNSKCHFFAEGKSLTFLELQKEFQSIYHGRSNKPKRNGKIREYYKNEKRENFPESAKFKRFRRHESGLVKRIVRLRKQNYHIYINALLENADHIFLGKGKGCFSQFFIKKPANETPKYIEKRRQQEIRNFAVADFENILRNKMNYAGILENLVEVSDTLSIEMGGEEVKKIEFFGIEGEVQLDLFHAFCLAFQYRDEQDNLTFSKEQWNEFIKWNSAYLSSRTVTR